jgi:hypothetical protein
MGCSCYACGYHREIWPGSGIYWATMYLCPTCGNKRCPGAASHYKQCTGSNEPGQKGSLYEGQKLPGK